TVFRRVNGQQIRIIFAEGHRGGSTDGTCRTAPEKVRALTPVPFLNQSSGRAEARFMVRHEGGTSEDVP
ncbi:MAG TPA: hypothetical protein VHS29_12085, partial [Candidatus Acidoferrales bacterium]|nr:hypothetical protein [Candidatus Acidoferrales bacterium]